MKLENIQIKMNMNFLPKLYLYFNYTLMILLNFFDCKKGGNFRMPKKQSQNLIYLLYIYNNILNLIL